MAEDEEIKLQKVWTAEIERLDRKLELWTRIGLSDDLRFRRTAERKRRKRGL